MQLNIFWGVLILFSQRGYSNTQMDLNVQMITTCFSFICLRLFTDEIIQKCDKEIEMEKDSVVRKKVKTLEDSIEKLGRLVRGKGHICFYV
jgi:hypothetical protein